MLDEITELYLTPEQWEALPEGERCFEYFTPDRDPLLHLWRIWKDESGRIQDADVFLVLDADAAAIAKAKSAL